MNNQVRYSPGVGGTLVLVAAWCPRCECETAPNVYGYCNWCELRIVEPAVARGDVVADDYTVAA